MEYVRYTKIAPLFLTTVLLIVSAFVAACQPEGIGSPRLATQTALSFATPTVPATPLLSEAPTATASPATTPDSNLIADEPADQSITLWVNESSDIHEEMLKQMIDNFSAESGTIVELLLVSPGLMPELVQTAVISGTLPDLILHPTEFSHGWAEQGILDPAAATAALDQLGRESFDPAALDMLSIPAGAGAVAALPSDGWKQLIIYRSDWFEELELDPPNTFESLLAAAEAIYEPEGLVTGLIVPTDASLITTQQVFEQIASANGCELVADTGEITLLHPACLEALEFYRMLVNDYSPIGFQTDTSALIAYMAGRTGMIVTSPAALPVLAGLDDRLPPSCPGCDQPDYLAKNSGFITELSGSGEFAGPATFGQLTALGFTGAANNELAAEFVYYWFDEGYSDWLSVNPERKLPMRHGTDDERTLHTENWGDSPLKPGQPSLNDVYGQELVDQLSSGVASSERWAFEQGQGPLLTSLYEKLTLPLLLQEMLSGYFTSSQTIVEMHQAVIDLIPNYAFPIEVAPTSTP